MGNGKPITPRALFSKVLDFLPKDPTSPVTAASLAMRRAVPGEIRRRRLSSLIRGRSISIRCVNGVNGDI